MDIAAKTEIEARRDRTLIPVQRIRDMDAIDTFMTSFGFGKNTFIIGIICLVVLLGNFTGGLIRSIHLSQGGPIRERPLTKRTSFRIVIVAELLIFVYAGYYHTVLVPGITTPQMVYWTFIFLAAPLLAAIGAQLTYVAFAGKIDKLRKQGLALDRGERSQAMAEEFD